MKIRSGFVSNSSSSSFVIALEKVPATKKELQELLFGEGETYYHPYPESYKDTYTAEEIAGIVWNDMKEPMTPADVRATIGSGYVDGAPEMDYSAVDWKSAASRTEHCDRINAEQDAYAYKRADEFMANHPGCVFLEFHYEDDDPLGCAMEHGTLFDRVPCFGVSHH